jgi:hypothetical protein
MMMSRKDESVAIWAPNGSIVRLAQLDRALADGVEHGLGFGPRARDDAEDLAGRSLLLQCFTQFTGEPADLCFPANWGTTTDRHLRRNAALSRCRLTARFSWFTTYPGAPSHCLPTLRKKAS